MKGWVGLVGWPVADGLPTLVVIHQLQVERRTGKVRQSEIDVPPLCYATIGRVGLAMVSQCTKFEVSRFTRYVAMNGSAKCRKWGGLGSLGGTQGHRQYHHSIERIRLLFDFIRNYVSIFYRFPDIAGYLSKVADIDPTCIWRSRRGWPRSNFAKIFGFRKLESLGYRVVLFVWSYV